MKRKVAARAAQREPHLVWNAFVDLLAMEEYDALSPKQRAAQLVFCYESEVQNGGHGQYLENQGTGHLSETVLALRDLGLPCQAGLVEQLAEALSSAPTGQPWEKVLPRGLTERLDSAFHACSPDIISALERHLELNRDEYVELV